MSIALKEANETSYWLDLLRQGGYVEEESFVSVRSDAEELIKLLVSIVKSAKGARRSE